MLYTRQKLITLCECAIVTVNNWHDRDSSEAQINIGKCWALLRAGCLFEILNRTDEDTIYISIYFPDFNRFQDGEFDLKNKDSLKEYSFYIPTRKRLNETVNKDWY